jgi:Xaa-Pro aminopeptidase
MGEHTTRLARLQELLTEHQFDGMLVSQNVDLFYLCGSMQTGVLFVPTDGEPLYLVRRSVMRATQESAVPVVEWAGMKTFAAQLGLTDRMSADGPPLKLALELDVLPVQHWMRYRQALPNVDWVDGAGLLRTLRMCKSSMEVERIRRAAVLVEEAFRTAAAEIRAGMTELELLVKMETTLRVGGHLGPMRLRGFNQEIYNGLVGSAAHIATPTYFDGPAGGAGLSAAFPQGASCAPLVPGSPILVDVGCNVEGYIIDQTRTFVIGQLSPAMQRAYEQAQAILHALEQRLRPGAVCEELYAEACRLADEAGLAEHFMGFGSDRVKFVGHGIGLEVDEWPVLAPGVKTALQAGMVLAVEPKFSFPGEGVVGIEDSYLITEHGYERLTVTEQRLISV